MLLELTQTTTPVSNKMCFYRSTGLGVIIELIIKTIWSVVEVVSFNYFSRDFRAVATDIVKCMLLLTFFSKLLVLHEGHWLALVETWFHFAILGSWNSCVFHINTSWRLFQSFTNTVKKVKIINPSKVN